LRCFFEEKEEEEEEEEEEDEVEKSIFSETLQEGLQLPSSSSQQASLQLDKGLVAALVETLFAK